MLQSLSELKQILSTLSFLPIIFGCLHSSFIECWLLDPSTAGLRLSERGRDFVVVQNWKFLCSKSCRKYRY